MDSGSNSAACEFARGLLQKLPNSMRFSLGEFAVLATSRDEEPLEWARWFTSSHFDTDSEKEADWHVSYIADADKFNTLTKVLSKHPHREIPSGLASKRKLLHKEFAIPDMHALFNDEFNAFCCAWPEERKLLLLSGEDSKATRYFLVRSIRKLITLHYERNGGVVLHSSAFEKNGEVTLGIAPRRGGKTTFLIHHLLEGANFITNDRTLLLERDGLIRAWGLPNKITLRKGIFDPFPHLAKRVDVSCPYEKKMIEGDAGSSYLTSGQLCALVGARPSLGGIVRRVAFVSPEACHNSPVPPKEANDLLKESFFDYGDRPRVFFSSLYPVDLATFRNAAEVLCERIITSCDCRYIGWNAAAKDFADLPLENEPAQIGSLHKAGAREVEENCSH